MDAVILLNKPAGITSFDAVRQCRRIFHEKKVGHTGTLDPEASGLMIILMGRYTKLLPFCVKDHKKYHAAFSFGFSTDTQDIWGTKTSEKEPVFHSDEELKETAEKMTGRQQQIPPMYAAIKKDGRKLYEYARKGIEVEREPREIEVSSLEVCRTGDNTFTMDAVVSSGTYIRTLISDYAENLGELAVMTSLVRSGIEHLSLADAADLSELESGKGLLSPLQVIDPVYEVIEAADDRKVRNGMKIRLSEKKDQVMFVHEGELLAAYEKRDDGLYHCLRGLF